MSCEPRPRRGGAHGAHRALAPDLLASALLALVACSRTPPEPAPATTTSSPTPSSRPAAATPPIASSARCITPIPISLPSIPKPASSAACPPDPEAPASMPKAAVAFPDSPDKAHVDVELAVTPHDVEKGLMYRRAMPEDHGMLFRLEAHRDHTFWMHNTCISLDMLFVDDDGMIVGIVEGAPPLDDGTRSVGCPSSYVLEVNAGFCRRHGVRPGQRLGLPAAVR